jgi:magnesium chelatase accessory protein
MMHADSRAARPVTLVKSDRLIWERDGLDWPNRRASRFVPQGRMNWHVQLLGQGPTVLLVHGTGASTHSWRDVIPPLARRFTVVAIDLPGHGFTSLPPAHLLSLPHMAQALGDLLHAMDLAPALAVGHSAGAAILARMCLDRRIAPAGLISLNGALLPLGGAAGQFFSPMAKLLVSLPMVPQLFAIRAASDGVIERLLDATGSRLDPAGIELYRRLVRSPRHVSGALGMMANWDLPALKRDLRRLAVPLVLVAGANDRTIPPRDAERVKRLVPAASIVTLPGLGHLAHEERPAEIADLIERFARSWHILEG